MENRGIENLNKYDRNEIRAAHKARVSKRQLKKEYGIGAKSLDHILQDQDLAKEDQI